MGVSINAGVEVSHSLYRTFWTLSLGDIVWYVFVCVTPSPSVHP